MRSIVPVLFACAIAGAIQGCVSKGTPIVELTRPHFVPQSSPDSIVETGIRQDPNTGGILLEWYPVNGAAGYQIYRSDTTDENNTPIHFNPVGNVLASSSISDTSMVDVKSIQNGVRYYYYLTAYGSDQAQTAHSDTISYKLLNRPGANYPSPNLSVDISNGLHFSWADKTGGGYTVIRLKDITDIPPQNIWVTKKFQIFESYPTENFNFDSTATSPLVSGNSYQWRVERFDLDGTGRPYEGSTSNWVTFTVK